MNPKPAEGTSKNKEEKDNKDYQELKDYQKLVEALTRYDQPLMSNFQ